MAEAAHSPSPTRPLVSALGAERVATRQAQTARQAPATAVSCSASRDVHDTIELIHSGLVCTDGGITSGVIVSEYGYADFGANYGGERTSVRV